MARTPPPQVGDGGGGGGGGDGGRTLIAHPGPIPKACRDQIRVRGFPYGIFFLRGHPRRDRAEGKAEKESSDSALP